MPQGNTLVSNYFGSPIAKVLFKPLFGTVTILFSLERGLPDVLHRRVAPRAECFGHSAAAGRAGLGRRGEGKGRELSICNNSALKVGRTTDGRLLAWDLACLLACLVGKDEIGEGDNKKTGIGDRRPAARAFIVVFYRCFATARGNIEFISQNSDRDPRPALQYS